MDPTVPKHLPTEFGQAKGAFMSVTPGTKERSVTTTPSSTAYWDKLTAELQSQRGRVGNPSYAVIADRITGARVKAGASPHAARVPRATVYDTFRMGRKVNLFLYREIAHALDASEVQVEAWLRNAQAASPPVRPQTLSQVVLLVVACVGLNLIGRLLVDALHLPIYLDMMGTAVAAIALGPWRGALVGGTTNLVGVIGSGWVSIPFALVNIAGALVWGYGVRRFGMGNTLPRFFALNLIAAWVCSGVAIPILIALLSEDFKDGSGAVVEVMKDAVPNLWLATGLSNVVTSTTDKLLSGFIALVAITTLPLQFRTGFPLAQHLAQLGKTQTKMGKTAV